MPRCRRVFRVTSKRAKILDSCDGCCMSVGNEEGGELRSSVHWICERRNSRECQATVIASSDKDDLVI